MNLDTSIYRMAFREADTLGVAQVLVAKKRADLEHQLLLKQVNEGSPSTGADLERAPKLCSRSLWRTLKIAGHYLGRVPIVEP